jgi:FMN phosphatase YigB (HAD superfamily)
MISLRREIEANMTADAFAMGRDPEFSHHQVLTDMLQRLGVERAPQIATEIARWETQREAALTVPIASMVEFIDAKLKDGYRVVATSDTRYSADDLSYIFEHHQLPTFSAIYASADYGAGKFSGRLFDIVARQEGVPLHAIHHIGDTLTADILSPAQRGVSTQRVRRPPRPIAAHPLPAPPSVPEVSDDPAFIVGYSVFGPILVAFTRLLLAQAERDGAKVLAFVARDGDLLLRLARILSRALPEEERPFLSYLHLSRRAITTARATSSSTALLLRYLHEKQVFDKDTALVDIGWAGSIRRSVAELAVTTGATTPRAYYLGLFDETAPVERDPDVHGLLCDQRRSRGPVEGAAWHAAFLLEAICRASHGTVVGYELSPDGAVVPVHAQSGKAREAEEMSEGTQQNIRAGILAYAEWWAQTGAFVPANERAVRRAAQNRLFRLAFFPSPAERRIGRQLVHTESVGGDEAMTLSLAAGGGLRGWLAGMRSPWKGAFFRETGGIAAAAAYCLVASVISAMPAGTALRLRRVIFR